MHAAWQICSSLNHSTARCFEQRKHACRRVQRRRQQHTARQPCSSLDHSVTRRFRQRRHACRRVRWRRHLQASQPFDPTLNDRCARRSFDAHSASQTNRTRDGRKEGQTCHTAQNDLLIRVQPTSSRLFTHSASARGSIRACPRARQRDRAIVTQAARRAALHKSRRRATQQLTWWLRQTPARCDRPCSRGATHTPQCVHDASSADTGCFAWSLWGYSAACVARRANGGQSAATPGPALASVAISRRVSLHRRNTIPKSCTIIIVPIDVPHTSIAKLSAAKHAM